MKNIKKITAAILACICIALSLAGCAANENERVIGTCGTYDVLYEELRFVTMTYKKILDETYGDGNAENGTIWDDPVLAQRHLPELEEKVMQMLEQNYRVLIACAAHGIGRDVLESAEIQAEVDRQVKSAEESFSSRDAFLKDMEANFMTESLYRHYLAREQMKYKLRDAVLKDESSTLIRDQQSFHAWIREGNGVYVQHVLIRNDEGEDIETNRLIATEISRNLRSHERHIDEYVGNAFFNEDLTNVSPYYLIPSLYDEALVEAGQRLYEVGDASEVVETKEGFWVLQRIEEPEGELDRQIGDLFDAYLWAAIGADTSDGVTVTVEFNDYGKSILLSDLR